MNFICEQFSVVDRRGSISYLEFLNKEVKDTFHYNSGYELPDQNYRYFRFVRFYPEDLYENNLYTIETSESDIELGLRDSVMIHLTKEAMKFNWWYDEVEIGLKLTDKEFIGLRKILKSGFKEKIVLFDE